MFLIVRLTVRDYPVWKSTFDEYREVRATHGCSGHTIYRNAHHPNDLTIVYEYESQERAEEFMRDPSILESLEVGGVISETSATWTEQAEVVSYR